MATNSSDCSLSLILLSGSSEPTYLILLEKNLSLKLIKGGKGGYGRQLRFMIPTTLPVGMMCDAISSSFWVDSSFLDPLLPKTKEGVLLYHGKVRLSIFIYLSLCLSIGMEQSIFLSETIEPPQCRH